MTDKKYSMSFTTAPLLYNESLMIAALFAEVQDWSMVRETVLAENRLQMRTVNSSKRIFQEISSRLKQLTPAQMETLLESEPRDQNHLLWLAFCKRYRFVYDFAATVMREKYVRLDLKLTYEDYDIFFNHKAEWHPEVERVAEATRKKLRQFLFRIMREAELLNQQGQIVPVLLSPRVADVIVQDDPTHLTIFPISEMDIKTWINR